MKLYVFLGPTLCPEDAAQAAPSAMLLPPVGRGDVLRLVLEKRPSAIAIIDGYFDSVPAVTHKEILFALFSGVRVFGASSMGALRAAELWQFGMEGSGQIYAHYRDGTWEADDEVAVTHGPPETGYRASSVALANIRIALREAARRAVISAEVEDRLVAVAKSTFYADRSWEDLFAKAADCSIPAAELKALKGFITSECPDAKRDDALEMLRNLRKLDESSELPRTPQIDFDFEPSIYWEQLAATSRTAASVSGLPPTLNIIVPELVRHVNLRFQESDVRRGAALLHLLATGDGIGERYWPEEQLRRAVRQFRRRHGLLLSSDAENWLHRQALSQTEFELLMRLELALEAVLIERGDAVARLVPLELKRRGIFDREVRLVAEKNLLLERMGIGSLALEDTGLTFSELMNWYQSSFETFDGSIESYATRLGFNSARQFLSEVMLEYKMRH